MVVMLGQQQRRKANAERCALPGEFRRVEPRSTDTGHEPPPRPIYSVSQRDHHPTWPEWCAADVTTPLRDGLVGKYGERFGSCQQPAGLAPSPTALIRPPRTMGRGTRRHSRLRLQHGLRSQHPAAPTGTVGSPRSPRLSMAMQELVATCERWQRDIREGNVVARRAVVASITAILLVISTVSATFAG